MKDTTVSIIIPTLNEEKYISLLLHDLTHQTRLPDEIIVVDCGSTDTTQKRVRNFEYVKLLETHKPVGHQRQYGGEHAKGDMLIFFDADVRLEPTTIESLLKETTYRKLDCACPTYVPTPGNFLISLFYSLFNIIFKATQKVKASGAGSCIIVSKKTFNAIGGFRAEYVYDDIVFIRTAGYTSRFGILTTPVSVSDRRIRRDGIIKTFWTYSWLSILFACDLFALANHVDYPFGHYNR